MSVLRLTREEARAIDRAALEEYGIPSLVLMEHAGRSVAELVRELAHDGYAFKPVTIVCGRGNNGGDGFVIARFLQSFGLDVECLCTAPLHATEGDARIERRIALLSGLTLFDATNASEWMTQRERLLGARSPRLYVDALFGTGFRGALEPEAARAITIVNELRATSGSFTVAVDLPSGLDCDTGARADPTIMADVTATFVAEKRGFAAEGASVVLGRVVVLPIGIPESLLARVRARAGAS